MLLECLTMPGTGSNDDLDLALFWQKLLLLLFRELKLSVKSPNATFRAFARRDDMDVQKLTEFCLLKMLESRCSLFRLFSIGKVEIRCPKSVLKQ